MFYLKVPLNKTQKSFLLSIYIYSKHNFLPSIETFLCQEITGHLNSLLIKTFLKKTWIMLGHTRKLKHLRIDIPLLTARKQTPKLLLFMLLFALPSFCRELFPNNDCLTEHYSAYNTANCVRDNVLYAGHYRKIFPVRTNRTPMSKKKWNIMQHFGELNNNEDISIK